jgi:hypothetical protein
MGYGINNLMLPSANQHRRYNYFLLNNLYNPLLINLKLIPLIVPGGEDMSEWINVKLKDVLGAELMDSESHGESKKVNFRCCLPNPLKDKSKPHNLSPYLVLHYAQVKTNSDKWRKVTLDLYHEDYSVLNKWFNTIQAALDGILHLHSQMRPYKQSHVEGF